MATSPSPLARLRPSGGRAARRPGHRWQWLLALVPGFFVRAVLDLGLLNIDQVVGLAVAGALLLYLSVRPDRVVRALILILPFQLLLTSAVYALGMNGGAVRMLGLWKEVAAAALVVAAVRAATNLPRRFDALDRLGLAYIALGTAFLVAQPALVGGPGSTVTLDDRFVSWRSAVLPVVLLLAARHVRLATSAIRSATRAVLGLGAVLGVIALVELALSGWWNSFLVDTLGVNRFRVDVLDVPIGALAGRFDDVRIYGLVGGREIVRMGGPMVGQLAFSFLLVVLFALVLEQAVSGSGSRHAPLVAMLVGLALLLTQTRSSILGGLIVLVLVVRRRAGRSDEARRHLALLAVAGIALLIPLSLTAGLTDRLTGGDAASDRSHSDSRDRAVEAVVDDPIGRGLGMGALAGNSLTPDAIVAENQLLDVGVQLGVVGMALFAAVGVVLVVRLGRLEVPGGPSLGSTSAALGMRSALIGLLVPCWFLQPFLTPEVGWVVFVLAGAVLGACERERAEVDDLPVPEELHEGWRA